MGIGKGSEKEKRRSKSRSQASPKERRKDKRRSSSKRKVQEEPTSGGRDRKKTGSRQADTETGTETEEDTEKGKRRKKRKAEKRKDRDSDDSSSSEKGKRRTRKDGDSSEDDSRKKKKKKQKKRKRSTDSSESSSEEERHFDKFDRLASLWRIDSRPQWMKERSIVNKMKWGEIMEVRKEHKEVCRESGLGEAGLFTADVKLPTVKYAEGKDNRASRLHPASFLRMPIVDPEDYWKKMPVRREPVFRNVPISHCNGNTVVNEIAIARMHDRTQPVTLKMLIDTNFAKRPTKEASSIDVDWEAPVKLRVAQSAFFSYASVLRTLWPMDYTPEALGQVLVKMDWGGAHRTDAARANLVELIFNRVMIENAQRAVKGKQPAEHHRIRELWDELLENVPKQAVIQGQQGHQDSHGGGNRGGLTNRGGRGARGGGKVLLDHN